MTKYEKFCEKVSLMGIASKSYLLNCPPYEIDLIINDLKINKTEFYEFVNKYANKNQKQKAVAETTTKQKN